MSGLTSFQSVLSQCQQESQTGSFRPIITVELSPPKGTDVETLLKQVRLLKGRVDAINVPDCQLSILKMSAMAAAKIIQDETGLETIWQLTCRDRNLLALQADMLGAYALGLRHMLALTGDPIQIGDQKNVAKQVFHLDSLRLLELVKSLNNGLDAEGVAFKQNGTNFTVGAALDPHRLRSPAQQIRLRRKLERGVQFFQTQPVYHRDVVCQMNDILAQAVADVGCLKPPVLLGIVPPRSAQAARRMNQAVWGINIPEALIERLEASTDPATESVRFCADLVGQLRLDCQGFHFMPVGMASKMPELLSACFVGV